MAPTGRPAYTGIPADGGFWRGPGAPKRAASTAIGVAVCFATGLTSSHAEPFRVEPRASVGTAFTDNARLTPTNEQSDIYATATVGAAASASGGRVALDFDAEISYDKYSTESDIDGYRGQLLGSMDTELIEDMFFVDVRASIAERNVSIGSFSPATERSVNNGDRTRVYTGLINPYLKNDLSGWAESTVSATISRTEYDRTDVGGVSTTPDAATDFTGSVALDSGRRFEVLQWGLLGRVDEELDGPTDTGQRTVQGSVAYVINRFWAVQARAGYDDVDQAPGVTEDRSGAYYQGGLRLTPGPRTYFSFFVGRRYNSLSAEANGWYEVTPTSRISVRYTDAVVTQSRAIATSLSGIQPNDEGTFTDPVGVPVGLDGQDPNSVTDLGIVSGSFQQRSLQLGYAGEWLSVSGVYETRDLGVPGIPEEQVAAISVGAFEDLSPRLKVRAGVGYRTVLQGRTLAEENDLYTASAEAVYLLGDGLSVTGQVVRRAQKQGTGIEVAENVVGLALTKRW